MVTERARQAAVMKPRRPRAWCGLDLRPPAAPVRPAPHRPLEERPTGTRRRATADNDRGPRRAPRTRRPVRGSENSASDTGSPRSGSGRPRSDVAERAQWPVGNGSWTRAAAEGEHDDRPTTTSERQREQPSVPATRRANSPAKRSSGPRPPRAPAKYATMTSGGEPADGRDQRPPALRASRPVDRLRAAVT